MMLKDLFTVLYYSSSREDPEFENKIVKTLLLECGDLPIVSVTQKPLNLGKNICVGDVGLSYFNEWRQMTIGLKEVRTPFIICAEADFLYPKEYFTFVPPREGRYFYNNTWVVYKDASTAGSYRQKDGFSDGAQICSTKFMVKEHKKYFAGKPQWLDDKDWRGYPPFGELPWHYFGGKIACVTFKTESGVQKYASVRNEPGTRALKLPYWGHVADLRTKYFIQDGVK